MHEYAWLHGNDFRDMVAEVGKRRNARRMRLAACACFRRVWDLLGDADLRAAVELAEDFADHTASWQDLKRARQALTARVQEAHAQFIRDKSAIPDWVRDEDDAYWWETQAHNLPVVRAAGAIELLLRSKTIDPDVLLRVAWGVNHFSPPTASIRDSLDVYCPLLRDIFGNPFRPTGFDTAWRTDTAVSLAKHIYATRDFAAMPILADALQDAGCENPDVLDHCRDANGVHVRGCWVVDLVLGKE